VTASPDVPLSRFIQLPRSSGRANRTYASVKLVTRILPSAHYNLGWEGRKYPPGALVERSELIENAIALECAGPQGTFKRGLAFRRDWLWILWRYNWQRGEWVEVARALAINWEWALVLRQPAIQLLYPKPEFFDLLQRGKDVASEVMGLIEQHLQGEDLSVRVNALASIYDQVAGRIAEAAA
jgi:hypothetical protein